MTDKPVLWHNPEDIYDTTTVYDPEYHQGWIPLYAAPVQPVKQEPVAWHHPECKGECIACLIERCVKDSYGTQGLDFMLRHINAAPVDAKAIRARGEK